jgi:hypothetical protein
MKLFKGVETDLTSLETEVNTWLAESGAKVVNVIGNIAPQTTKSEDNAGGGRMFPPSDVMLAVLYETG